MSDSPKVMWSIGQIAERDGISRQAISKIVRKLVADHDIPVERDGRGRVSKVSLAHFDHHRGQYTNPAKQPLRASQAGKEAPTAPAKPVDTFEEARRQNEWLKVERTKIEQQELAGRLVRADRLSDALDLAGREIQAVVDRLQNRADDIALAVSKEGAHGARVLLREIGFTINRDIADKLEKIAGDAPRQDAPIEEAERQS